MTRQDLETKLPDSPEIFLLAGLTICIFGVIGLVIPALSVLLSGAGVLCALWIPGFATMTLFHPQQKDGWRCGVGIGSILISVTLLTIAALILEQLRVPAFESHAGFHVTSYLTGFILLYSSILTVSGLIIYQRYHQRIHTQALSHLRESLPTIIIILLITGAFTLGSTWILSQIQPERSTELWLLSENGTAGSYQTTATSGGVFTAFIGIKDYSSSQSEFFLITKVNGTIVKTKELHIPPEGEVIFPVTINPMPGVPGDLKLISYDLYQKKSSVETPFRRVSLPVRIV